jgi:transmembrane sensor
LDAASDVEVRYSSDRRDLELRSGRAKFDVAKNPLRPFTVAAGDKLIVATGTSFSVEILHGRIEVILYEGHVAVLPRSAGVPPSLANASAPAIAADRSLRPGSELSLPDHGPPVVASIDPARSLSWEGGQLSFTDEPLGIAAERMNRYAATPVTLVGEKTAAIPISGVFNAGDTSAFVAGVTGVFPVRSRNAGKTIVLESSAR